MTHDPSHSPVQGHFVPPPQSDAGSRSSPPLATQLWVSGSSESFLVLHDEEGVPIAHGLREDTRTRKMGDLQPGSVVFLGPQVGRAPPDVKIADPRPLAALLPEVRIVLGREVQSATEGWHHLHHNRDDDQSGAADCGRCRLALLRKAVERAEKYPEFATVFANIDDPATKVLRTNAVTLDIDRAGLGELDRRLVEEQRRAREVVEKAYPGIDPTKDVQAERFLRKVAGWSAPPDCTAPVDHELPRLAHLDRLSQTSTQVAAAMRVRDIARLRKQAARLCATSLRTGRLHPTYLIGNSTGRVHTTGAGCVQNINKRLRQFIRAGEGSVFVVADFQAFELRPMACLSQEAKLLELLQSGEDLHRAVASTLYEVPAGEVADSQRSVGKRINFLIPFGGGSHGLAETAGIEVREAAQLLAAYDQRFPTLAAWRKKVQRSARNGMEFVRLPSGRLLHLGTCDDGTRARRAIAYTVQGTAADIAKLALVRVAKALEEHDLGQVAIFLHDEIVARVPTARAKKAKTVVEQAMVVPPPWMPEVPLSVDAAIRETWGEA